MSQLIGALFRRVATAETHERAAEVFAAGMAEATRAGYEAVAEPVEGTILSVARAASEAAAEVVRDPAKRSADVMEACRKAAWEALQRTPDQLEVLARAGVVDAGGRGLCVVLSCAEAAYTGRHELVHQDVERTRRALPVIAPALPHDDLSEDGPAYEVMYLLDADDEAIPALRQRLAPLGDSLVVVGGERLWNVHVHVDDVGAALEAGIEAGRPYRVRVTHFAEQVAAAAERSRRRAGPRGRGGGGRARDWRRSSPRPGPRSCRDGWTRVPRPASWSRPWWPPAPTRSCCCPTTVTSSRPRRPRPGWSPRSTTCGWR